MHSHGISECSMPPARRNALLAVLIAMWIGLRMSLAGDWPQWRYDAQRSAAAPEGLSAQLRLHWVRQLPPLTPCWPDQPKMHFDAAYEPIVEGQRLFIGSSHHDFVTAYDTRTGTAIWTYFVDAPVRFPPLA